MSEQKQPVSADREKNFRYRASFQKTGETRSLTHLELAKTLRHGFREAGIPLSNGVGSHPQPQISFGPALPLHVESGEEFLDFYTYLYVSPERFVSSINKFLPEELAFLEAVQISKTALSLSCLINGADYSVDFTGQSIGRDAQASAIERFHNEPEILFTKHKNEKVVNIKEYVRSLRFDPCQNRLWIEMKIVEGATVGIQQVVRSLHPVETELPVRRERMYAWQDGRKRSPLTLEWEELQIRKHLMDLTM